MQRCQVCAPLNSVAVAWKKVQTGKLRAPTASRCQNINDNRILQSPRLIIVSVPHTTPHCPRNVLPTRFQHHGVQCCAKMRAYTPGGLKERVPEIQKCEGPKHCAKARCVHATVWNLRAKGKRKTCAARSARVTTCGVRKSATFQHVS